MINREVIESRGGRIEIWGLVGLNFVGNLVDIFRFLIKKKLGHIAAMDKCSEVSVNEGMRV